MEYFTLTKEAMLKAETYMPIADKIALAKRISTACVQPVKAAKQNKPADNLISLPMMQEEDCALKNILLLNTLLGYYFDIEITEGEDPYTLYDYYSGGHLLNQIERFKGDRETKDIAFDILDDFREFKKMVDTMIFNEKTNANDPLGRLAASIELLADPENLKILAAELQKSGDELAEKVHRAKVLGAIPEAEKPEKEEEHD